MRSSLINIAKSHKNYIRNNARFIKNSFSSRVFINFQNHHHVKQISHKFSIQTFSAPAGTTVPASPIAIQRFVEFIDLGDFCTGIVQQSTPDNKLMIIKIDPRYPAERKTLFKTVDQIIYQFPFYSISPPAPVDRDSIIPWSLVYDDVLKLSHFFDSSADFDGTISDQKLHKFWEEREGQLFTEQDAFNYFSNPSSDVPIETQHHAITRMLFLNNNYFHFQFCSSGKLFFTARSAHKMKELQSLQNLLHNKDECSYFVRWAKEQTTKEIDALTNALFKKPGHMFDKPKPAPVQWDLKRIAPFLQLLKTYTFVDENKELYNPDVVIKLLKPLLVKGRSTNVYQLLRKLKALSETDNIYKLKAEGETVLLNPHPPHIVEIASSPHISVADIDDTGRVDIGGLPVYTVDDETTTEVDDGISIERDGSDTWIHVHIADPTRLFTPESELDKYARKRAATIYLPEIRNSMFPKVLAEGPMSIVHNSSKNYTLTFSAKLSKSGEILEYKITPTIIRNVVKMDYTQVDAILNNSTSVSPLQLQDMQELHEIATTRKNYRNIMGARAVSLPKPEIKVKTDGSIVFSLQQETPSNILVSEMMILAGEIAAKYAIKHGFPVPFRYQTSVVDVKENENPLLYAWEVIKASASAQASVDPKPHQGMGLEAYCRATSPIRRYMDILTHFQIKMHLSGQALPFSYAQLNEIVPLVHSTEREIKKLQTNSTKFWLLRYMQSKGITNYDALVLSFKKSLTFYAVSNKYTIDVFLPALGHKATIFTEEPIPVGTTIQVQFKEANAHNASFNLITSMRTILTGLNGSNDISIKV